MRQMVTLTLAETREFLSRQGRRNVGVHNFDNRIAHWAYCARCGLVLLKNPRTRQAVKAACVTIEDD